MYKYVLKRCLDFILSFICIVVFALPMAIIAIAIKIDDPGPVFFKQKRVGKNKKLFNLYKFRSMKVNTPDIPTHLLKDPDQCITKVGRFLRKTSLDELPQLYNIFLGKMSVIGPRPALWNQDDLVAERDKYKANDVKPGLTGWAQINGRDELEIPVKAKFDGEYVEKLNKGWFRGFGMDVRCFFGTFLAVFRAKGVVEGAQEKNDETCDEKNEKPKVSVVVATYRQEESLKSALQSLAEQTYENFEVVLVDDNGVEEWNLKVKNIVDEFIANNPNVELHLLVNNPNQGSAKTRNRGISCANGEFVTFLDDDDVYLPNKILNQVTKMSQEDADYGLTDLCLYSEAGKLIDKRIRKYIKKTDPTSLMEYHYMFHMTGTDSMMFKKTYLQSIGGFNEQDLGDEFYLMQKAIAGQGKFCYVPVCDVKAVVHVGENGLSSGQNKIKCETMMYEHKKEYFPNLSRKARRYIKMRHYAVLAFAGLRMKKFGYTIKNGFASFFTAPIACIKLIIGRKV